MTTRKTSSYIRIAGGIICLLFSLAACDNQTIYHTYQNLSIEGWKKTDTLKYQLPAQLAGKQYDLEVGLRHTENYPYQDIWMEILYPLSPDRHPRYRYGRADVAVHEEPDSHAGSDLNACSGEPADTVSIEIIELRISQKRILDL
jgi:gliding motility-associated lipoprotein GldH